MWAHSNIGDSMVSWYPDWLKSWPNPYPGRADFIPKERIVIAITNDYPALITTSVDHGYLNGNIIRVDIPLGFGMQEINKQAASMTVLNATQFYINIDTRYYSAFFIPAGTQQVAQCIPIGENNDIIYNATFNDR